MASILKALLHVVWVSTRDTVKHSSGRVYGRQSISRNNVQWLLSIKCSHSTLVSIWLINCLGLVAIGCYVLKKLSGHGLRLFGIAMLLATF